MQDAHAPPGAGEEEAEFRLARLTVTNLFSFARAKFDGLAPVTLFTGQNNAGKTNIYRVLDLLASLLEKSRISSRSLHVPRDEVENRVAVKLEFRVQPARVRAFLGGGERNVAGLEDLLSRPFVRARVEVREGRQVGVFLDALGFAGSVESQPVVLYEHAGARDQMCRDIDWSRLQSGRGATRWALRDVGRAGRTWFNSFLLNGIVEECRAGEFIRAITQEFLAGIRFVGENRSFAPYTPLVNEAFDPQIDGTGANFPQVLAHLQLEAPAQWRAITADFQRLYPEIERLRASGNLRGNMTYPFLEVAGFPRRVRLDTVGGGMIQALVILTHLHQAPRNGTLLIEEPELFLHPALQKALFQIIVTRGRGRQVFLTTHSPFLLDQTRPQDAIFHLTRQKEGAGPGRTVETGKAAEAAGTGKASKVAGTGKAVEALGTSTVGKVGKRSKTGAGHGPAMQDGATTVVRFSRDACGPILAELGLRPSDFLLTNGFLFVEGVTDVTTYRALFRDLLAEFHLDLVPVHGKHNVPVVVEHGALQKLADKQVPWLVVLDRDEGNQQVLGRLSQAQRARVTLLPVRELENLFLNPALLGRYFAARAPERYTAGEPLVQEIRRAIEDLVTDALCRETTTKLFFDRHFPWIGKSDREPFLARPAPAESAAGDLDQEGWWDRFFELLKKRLPCTALDEAAIRANFSDCDEQTDRWLISGTEVWKHVPGKRALQALQDAFGVPLVPLPETLVELARAEETVTEIHNRIRTFFSVQRAREAL